MSWSDSLSNDAFVKQLALDFEICNVFSIIHNNSITILLMGNIDSRIGTDGRYILKKGKENNRN